MDIVSFIDVLRAALLDPRANPEIGAIAAALVVVLVLMLAAAVLLLVPPRKRRIRRVVRRRISGPTGVEPEPERASQLVEPASASEPESAVTGTRRPRKMSTIDRVVVSVLVVAAIGAAYLTSGTQLVCAQTCHATDAALVSVKHAGEPRCVECHESGALAVVENVTFRASMVWQEVTSSRVEPPVSARACVGCHSDILEGTVTGENGITVRHAEPLDAGWNCVDCHPSAGHSTETAKSGRVKATCSACHRQGGASNDCATCHVGGTDERESVGTTGAASTTLGSGGYHYPLVDAPDGRCDGCHDLATQCDPCHGIRMPHSTSFIEGYHARDAAFEKKETCWRCHDRADCSACHSPFERGHASDWRTDHQSASMNSGCGCHNVDSRGGTSMCEYCHGSGGSVQ